MRGCIVNCSIYAGKFGECSQRLLDLLFIAAGDGHSCRLPQMLQSVADEAIRGQRIVEQDLICKKVLPFACTYAALMATIVLIAAPLTSSSPARRTVGQVKCHSAGPASRHRSNQDCSGNTQGAVRRALCP